MSADDAATTAWLGVVSEDHVRTGVEQGIAQLGHGKHAGLARLKAGDWLVYYSPKESLGGAVSLKAFTAVGRVADDEIWQHDDGDFRPWRRRIDWKASGRLFVADVSDRLDLTSGPNWGYQLRRGLVTLTQSDLAIIRAGLGDSARTPSEP